MVQFRMITKCTLARFVVVLMVFLFTPFFVNLANAAPQILAAIKTEIPQPMGCEDGVCRVEIATFCLQKDRGGPLPGTLYIPHPDSEFTLVLIGQDGNQTEVPANALIKLKAKRGFTAVQGEIEQAKLLELGASSAALITPADVVLLPAKDTVPNEEANHAFKTLLPQADQWFNGETENSLQKALTLRLVNSLINETPTLGKLNDTDRKNLWNKVAQNTPQKPGKFQANEMFDACEWRVEIGRYPTLRSCLEIKHDSLLMDINQRYWQVVKK